MSAKLTKLTKLSNLNIGDQARIIGFNTHPSTANYRKKLLAMGLTPSTIVTVIRRAPFGDPIEVQVSHCHISLRQAEADVALQLEKINRSTAHSP